MPTIGELLEERRNKLARAVNSGDVEEIKALTMGMLVKLQDTHNAAQEMQSQINKLDTKDPALNNISASLSSLLEATRESISAQQFLSEHLIQGSMDNKEVTQILIDEMRTLRVEAIGHTKLIKNALENIETTLRTPKVLEFDNNGNPAEARLKW